MKQGIKDSKACENWARYIYGRDRGHSRYMEQVKLCERMYLGGGLQWSEEDKAVLRLQNRPAYEFNEVMPSVNSAIGYQIQNRMDISYQPRSEGDTETAAILSKVVMQIASQCKLHWVETQVLGDGLIQQRGYYDVRVNFDKNIKGEIEISYLDPLDVIPDPNAKSYDPDTWSDVLITRWMTASEIESAYGVDARGVAEKSNDYDDDFGDHDSDDVERNKFGLDVDIGGIHDAYSGAADGEERYRVIERQVAEWAIVDCLVMPVTGDVVTAQFLSDAQIEKMMSDGAMQVKRRRRQIRWIASTYSRTLHDAISPYEHFTIVPYFAFFRRGITRGLVDNAIGPQEALNKSVSQYVHIINTSANSGWVVQQNSLTNITTDELSVVGAKTGLVIEYKEGSAPPVKIQANQIPSGVDHLIDRATAALKSVTVPDAMRGQTGSVNESGVLFQAKQFAAQQQLAVPLDNLAYTRKMLAERILKLIQRYYDSYRVFRITETDPLTGKKADRTLEINKPDEMGGYINDVTVGTYDAVISESPMQVTFENTQFKQALDMREKGIGIPDVAVVRYSNLVDKDSIIETMQSSQAPDPEKEAKAKLVEAQTQKTLAEATSKAVETQFSAIQTAQVISTTPQTAPLADKLLKSAGYVDHDAPPIVPNAQPMAGAGIDLPRNTNPLTPLNPTNPAVGMNAGIETAAPDSATTTPTGV